MIEVKYGRDQATGKLHIAVGGKQRAEGAEKSVPMSVSREHALITIGDDASIVLRNLNIENDTYVNGTPVEQKLLRQGDVIELGKEHYRLDWSMITPFIPVFIDISPLRHVWEDYQTKKMDYQIKEKKFNVLKSLTSLITMSAFILGAVDVGVSGASLRLVFYVLAISVSIFFTVRSWKDASAMPKKYHKLEKQFHRYYVCPNPKCRHYMGANDYEILSQNKKCPYCGGIYIKSDVYSVYKQCAIS